MMSKGPILVKELPECQGKALRKAFLAEIKTLADHCYGPQLIVDLSSSPRLGPDAIDVLLQCVEHAERADGRVSVAAPSPEAAVILELTQLASVVQMFSSVSEAMEGDAPYGFESWGPEGSQHLAA